MVHHQNQSSKMAKKRLRTPTDQKGIKFAILFICILLGDFFVGYDSSCVATLTSVITDEFGTINDVGWYGTA